MFKEALYVSLESILCLEMQRQDKFSNLLFEYLQFCSYSFLGLLHLQESLSSVNSTLMSYSYESKIQIHIVMRCAIWYHLC